MGIIKFVKLIYDYVKRDEHNEIIETNRAINEIDLDIKAGDFVAVLGHNGSGKSTLAKHMNAILLPTEGTVWVDNIVTTDEGKLLEIRKTVGMVFQNPDNQIIANVVEEDVAFGPENLGVKSAKIEDRVTKSLEAVNMLEYRNNSPNRLSGGQKQRVAIAGIMAMKPRCIVLDEPTAMLDPKARKEVIDTIIRLNKEENISIVLITHYMEEVIEADRVIVMVEGNIVMDGTPKEVFKRVDELKSYRLDVPQVTELAHELKEYGLDIDDTILSIDEFVEKVVPKLQNRTDNLEVKL